MTKIYGHRGSKGCFPENTLVSIHEAIKAGVDGIEIDVHLSKDDQPVVIHDPSVNRTFEGNGLVRDSNVLELKKLKLNKVFQSFPNYQPAWDLEKIPTLAEVLKIIAPIDIHLNIELKTARFNYPKIEQLVLDCVAKHAPHLTVIYSSFHLPTLIQLRELDPSVELGYLIDQANMDVKADLTQIKINTIHLDQDLFEDFIGDSSINRKKIILWTVNQPDALTRFFHAGVGAIITDYPDRAIRLRSKFNPTSM